MIEWCLLNQEKYLNLILRKKKTWEVRTQQLFKIGERIALGNTKTRQIEGYATIKDVKKMSVAEILKHNGKHHASDFIDKRWKNRKWLYVFVLSKVEANAKKEAYPPSHGNPKVRLEINKN